MNIYIRDFRTRSAIKTIDVTGRSARECEKIVTGILINLNTEDYFVDDSECPTDDNMDAFDHEMNHGKG